MKKGLIFLSFLTSSLFLYGQHKLSFNTGFGYVFADTTKSGVLFFDAHYGRLIRESNFAFIFRPSVGVAHDFMEGKIITGTGYYKVADSKLSTQVFGGVGTKDKGFWLIGSSFEYWLPRFEFGIHLEYQSLPLLHYQGHFLYEVTKWSGEGNQGQPIQLTIGAFAHERIGVGPTFGFRHRVFSLFLAYIRGGGQLKKNGFVFGTKLKLK